MLQKSIHQVQLAPTTKHDDIILYCICTIWISTILCIFKLYKTKFQSPLYNVSTLRPCTLLQHNVFAVLVTFPYMSIHTFIRILGAL